MLQTNTDKLQSRRPKPDSQKAKALEQNAKFIPETAQRARVHGLTVAAAFGRARTASQARERARRLDKYGPGSPQEQAIARALDLEKQWLQETRVELDNSRVPVVDAKPNAFIVHGRVLGTGGEGLAGLTVQALQESRRSAEETVTDSIGYFKLEIPAKPAAGRTAAGAASGAAAGASPDAQAAAAGGTGGELFLRVLAGKSRILHADERGMPVVAGKVVARRIVVEGKGGKEQAAEPPRTEGPYQPKENKPPVIGKTAAGNTASAKAAASQSQSKAKKGKTNTKTKPKRKK